MPVAIRAITRLVDADDINVSLGAGVDEYALVYDHDTAKFVLRAPFAGLLATGATTGATARAQAFTLGVVSPFDAPAADSTTAWQVRKADKTTAVVTVDTTNARVGIGTSSPGELLHLDRVYTSDALTTSVRLTRSSYGMQVGGGLVNEVGSYGTFSTVHVADGVIERMRIAPSGNVGIGTTSPGAKLHVVDSTANDSTALKISASGTVGEIGKHRAISFVTEPTDSVSLVETTKLYSIHSSGQGDPSSARFTIAQYGNSGLVDVLTVKNGNVGIGTTSPATRLDIDAGAMTMAEMTAPTGVANKATLYTKDNGSGKTQLCVKLGDDVEIVIATQA